MKADDDVRQFDDAAGDDDDVCVVLELSMHENCSHFLYATIVTGE